MAKELQTCCGCFDLRTGTLIIGYLNLFASVGGALAGNIAIFNIDYDEIQRESHASDEDIRAFKSFISVLYGCVMVSSGINLLFTIMLLCGVYKHIRGLVMAYIVFAFVVMVLYIIFSIVTFGAFHLGYLLLKTLAFVTFCYFVGIVKAYHTKMADPTYNPTLNMS